MGTVNEKVLSAIIVNSDAGGTMTIRKYLNVLLSNVWEYGEGFNGKRPFGNSGWEWELYTALVSAGLVDGSIDDDGYLDEFEDEAKANKLIFKAIDHIFKEKTND